MKGDRYFDFTAPYEDGEVRVKGYVTRHIPATGPSMESAGGDPAEGGEIEDFEAWKIVDGKQIETEDADYILEALEDTILERVSEDIDDGPDPDERHDARMAGDE